MQYVSSPLTTTVEEVYNICCSVSVLDCLRLCMVALVVSNRRMQHSHLASLLFVAFTQMMQAGMYMVTQCCSCKLLCCASGDM